MKDTLKTQKSSKKSPKISFLKQLAHSFTHPLYSMKKQSGFTLIELMVVMAIIAILATAGLSAYTGYMKKGRDTSRVQIASGLNTAVVSYMASHQGVPPKNQTGFDDFIASSSDVFTGSSVDTSNGTLIKDPLGGKEVCLDAEGHADQPCSFHYTAYQDGTYAISYGVETKDAAKINFYKTTQSVKNEAGTNTIPKYGVYVGTAPFIGNPVTQQNTDVGVDSTYTAPFATKRIDVAMAGSGNGNEDTGGVTTITLNNKKWMTTDLPGYYQWMRKTPVTAALWPDAQTWTGNDPNNPDYGDPCTEFNQAFKMPTSVDLGALSRADIDTLALGLNGCLATSDGSPSSWGTYGYYWSSESSYDYASLLYFSPGFMDIFSSNRAYGFSVRCLQDLP